MLAKNIIGSLSFLFCGKILHCGDKKFGNFHLKGTFENNCLKMKKGAKHF
jgi:hypothetical protein